MRWLILLLVPGVAAAVPVQLVHQARVLDAAGAPGAMEAALARGRRSQRASAEPDR